MFKWSELLFVVAGIEKKKRKQNQIHPNGIKIGRSWLLFFLKRQSVVLTNCILSLVFQEELVFGYGLQRWTKRGYRHTSRMWYLFRIQVRNRSKPKPYPPWGHVPYFLCLKRREECLVYNFVQRSLNFLLWNELAYYD